jgi:hypothetical protein
VCVVRPDVVHSATGVDAARVVLTQTGSVAQPSNVGMVDVRGIVHVQSYYDAMCGACCVTRIGQQWQTIILYQDVI